MCRWSHDLGSGGAAPEPELWYSLSRALMLGGCVWPQFGWGPGHTSFNPLERTIGVGEVGGLHEVWRAHAGETSSPAVSGGTVYIGSSDGKLYALTRGETNCSGTPTTCAPLWTAQTGGPIQFSSPAIVDGTVFIGSLDHKLYAFDAAGKKECGGTQITSAPLWTATTDAPLFSHRWSPTASCTSCRPRERCPPTTRTARRIAPAVRRGAGRCGARILLPPRPMCRPRWRTALCSSPMPTDVCTRSMPTAARTALALRRRATRLWTGAVRGPDIAGSRQRGALRRNVRRRQSARLHVDARGDENCTGTRLPKTCQPLWTAPTFGQLLSMVAVPAMSSTPPMTAALRTRSTPMALAAVRGPRLSAHRCGPARSPDKRTSVHWRSRTCALCGAEIGPDTPSGDWPAAHVRLRRSRQDGLLGHTCSVQPDRDVADRSLRQRRLARSRERPPVRRRHGRHVVCMRGRGWTLREWIDSAALGRATIANEMSGGSGI